MVKKLAKKFVALSSGVVFAIYFAGYSFTQQYVSETEPAGNTHCVTTAHSTPSPLKQPVPFVTATLALNKEGTASAINPIHLYRNGVYCGTGTSEYGDVQVSVTIDHQRIRSVKITQVTTFFPGSYIAGLPSQVIQRQSTHIDLVTGATGSSDAFQGAIDDALNQATG